MTDLLEARLLADAARDDGPAPDFDIMLAAVTGRRRRPRGWLVAAAAAVVAAGGIAVVASSNRAGTQAPASTNQVSPFGDLTRHYSTRLTPEAVFVTASADELQVVVDTYPQSDPCYQTITSARLVETGARVDIEIAGYHYADPQGRTPRCSSDARTNQGSQAARGTIDLTLRQPLGGRGVYDAAGKVVVLDPADLPTLPSVPAGFTQTEPIAASADTYQYVGMRIWQRGNSQINLSVGRPVDVYPAGPRVGSTSVAGARATITSEAGTVCVDWPERDSGRARQLCADGLGVATTVALARTVR